MKKIFLNDKEIEKLVPDDLPMLIHGTEGSGASFYTICIATKWFSQNYSILFLCGYPMAQEEFVKQVGKDFTNVKFYTKNKVSEFLKALATSYSENTVVIIKNIELFDSNVIDAVHKINNLIISGDLSKSVLETRLSKIKFSTRILFSPLANVEVPKLNRYHGFFTSQNEEGIIRLE